jgi:Xaa-Pro aminopeptidase
MPVDDAYSIDVFEDDMNQYIQSDRFVSFYTLDGINENIDQFLYENQQTSIDPRPYIDSLRIIKSTDEIEIMKKSAKLACEAHILAMKSGYSGVSECHLQSIIEGYFISNRSRWAYQSIVGGGDNATILHYSTNQDDIDDGELVLIDAGCEIDGYASDITRTWPVNGVFTDAQREIYELVLAAEKAAIAACQVGAPWRSFHEASSRVLAQGLIDLGILDCSIDEALGDDLNGPYRNYFMHGTGHLLGLDVHDVGGGRQGDDQPGPVFTPGMVITVEPGLYFASWRTDVKIPERYSGIGVRIEDNILITDSGPVVLTESCPKEIKEIESLIGTGE